MQEPVPLETQIERAAELLQSADALLIGAGAGMGIDSGLPDFRGNEGFWKTYPPFQGKSFAEISNPVWFESDPAQAWGFFGHRLKLYRETEPHRGFEILKRWGAERPDKYFVYTSNVDGQFQKAGFDKNRILECHGSIHYLQCSEPCEEEIWSADDVDINVDPATIRASYPIPHCPECQAVARPNILMFDDSDWITQRYDKQYEKYAEWLSQLAGKRVVAIELGAGLAIATVRNECERRSGALIRINPTAPQVPPGNIGIALGALEALRRIDSVMARSGEPAE